mgnify:CR=1 FL=1
MDRSKVSRRRRGLLQAAGASAGAVGFGRASFEHHAQQILVGPAAVAGGDGAEQGEWHGAGEASVGQDFGAGAFDAVTCGFALRNFVDLDTVFADASYNDVKATRAERSGRTRSSPSRRTPGSVRCPSRRSG